MRKKKPVARAATRKQPDVTGALIAKLTKEFESGVIWSNAQDWPPIEVIHTRANSMNWVMGCGGFPRGRITEIFGPESSGKTTTCYEAISCVQRSGGNAAFIDSENSVDIIYMKQCGVDPVHLIIAQPEYGEQALTVLERLVQSGKLDLIVLDSVAALIPLAELEAEVSDQQVGLAARMMAKSMRRLLSMLKGSPTAIILTNQVRDKIGGFGGFGTQETTPGGRAIKHASALRLSIHRTKTRKSGSLPIGYLMRVRNVKNKVGPPGRTASVPVTWGIGIDHEADYISLLEHSKAIKKRSAIFYLKNKTLGNGYHAAYEKITANARLKEFMDKKLTEYLASRVTSGKLGEGKDDSD